MSASATPFLIKGGDIELYLDDGRTIVCQKEYGLAQDTEGRVFDKCSLFVVPVRLVGPWRGELPPAAADYFGIDYEARKAKIDIPSGKWNRIGRVTEILYYRFGEFEDDWRHEFRVPPPLFEQAGCYWMRLPEDCKLTWRGIERP